MSSALKNFLRENGKSQRWLADEFGVKPSSVNAWVNQRVPPGRVPFVSDITGLTYHDLRPDLYKKGAA